VPKTITKQIDEAAAQAACSNYVPAFKLDILKPVEYAGEDFQWAIAGGNVPDGRWSKRLIFMLTANLDGKVVKVAEVNPLDPR